MADNHRNFANQELNSDSISFIDQSTLSVQNQSNLEIPSEESITSDGSSVVNNNFNVNINSSSADTNAARQNVEAQTIINNVLNTINKDNPLAIKKNSNESLPEDGSVINLADTEVQDRTIPEERKFEQEESFTDYSQFLSPPAPLESLGISNVSFDLPSIANYTYSVAHIKQENNIIKNRIESIKDIIDKALNEVSLSEPGAAYQTNMSVQQMADNRMYFEDTNMIFDTGASENNYDELEEATREHHRIMELRQFETEKELADFEKQKDRKESESIDTSVDMRDIVPLPKTDATPTVRAEKVDNRIQHVNNMDSSGYKFITEINRPPVWRSVLG